VRVVLIVVAAMLATACSTGASEEDAPAQPAPVQIGAENVVRVARGEIVVGPVISGELRAAREATVRAELSGPMTDVAIEEGQAVRRGALLGRIEARQLEDARRSAETAVKSAENQLEVAEREASRTEELVKAGALAARDLDRARASVISAEAQTADARARLVSAQSQLADTVLNAPIAGIVSDRAVNTGDVVSPGTVLFTIIDPSSMRLEASVPSSAVGDLRIGARVRFTIRGYDQTFEGQIERINPQADPATRQVPIYVSIPNVAGRLVAGLFAEGRVVSQAAAGIIAPVNAVNTSDESPWVLRVNNGKAERVDVVLGLRDDTTEQVMVTQGLAEGDVLLRGAAQGITPGTPVRVGSAATAAAGTAGR
jgi:membrane fusion protein (multidrug efflux system)